MKTWKKIALKSSSSSAQFFFLYCQPAKNQVKSQFLFIKNISPRDLWKITSLWNLTMHIMILSLCTAWNFWLDNFHIWFWIGIQNIQEKLTIQVQVFWEGHKNLAQSSLILSNYSLFWSSYQVKMLKLKGRLCQIFVAFSEYMNFTV